MRHVIVLLAALTFMAPAAALPPPMSEKELDEKSDFVGVVKVLGVACTGHVEAPNKEQLLSYQAWLQVVKVKKGTAKPGDTLLVGWHDTPKMLIGPWKVEYYAGEEVSTHLRFDVKSRDYATTWWNAKGEPMRRPSAQKLPGKPGEVFVEK